MSLLLDSHALLWALHDPGKMSAAALTAIREPRTAVFYSAASVWELELKAAVGKLRLPDDWVDEAARAGFLELAVTAADALASARLPWHHKDPFDRVLVAQARRHTLRVATRDPLVSVYDVGVLTV